MRRAFPLSLLCFVLPLAVTMLQFIPVLGVILMAIAAVIVSVIAINAAMLGIALEAITGQIRKEWLLVPLLFYGGYYGGVAHDHYTLWALSKRYEAANAQMHVAFDPDRHALVFDEFASPGWLVQDYALPVAFSAYGDSPEEYQSVRMIDESVCASIRDNRPLQSARIFASSVIDDEGSGYQMRVQNLCLLTMPETPDRPQVRVRQVERDISEAMLPVHTIATIIETPNGQRVRTLGGFASPLGWIPMPIFACDLTTGDTEWVTNDEPGRDCMFGFVRNDFTSIVTDRSGYNGDNQSLARTLGLTRVAASSRLGVKPPESVMALLDLANAERMRLEIANVEARIADPLTDNTDWDVAVLAADADALAVRADAIMTGVERAAAAGIADQELGAENGRILASLLANLPPGRLKALQPRLSVLYRDASGGHWLWQARDLLERLRAEGMDLTRPT
jgi:hypothetical protein